jgi:hypothetical protein
MRTTNRMIQQTPRIKYYTHNNHNSQYNYNKKWGIRHTESNILWEKDYDMMIVKEGLW